VEFLIDAVKAASTEAAARAGGAAALNRTVLIDVGAAPYNTVGGDISHVLTFLKHWPASSGATIFGFEPGTASFRNLRTSISKATAPRPLVHMSDLVEGGGAPAWSRVQGTAGKTEGGSIGGAHHSETTYVVQADDVAPSGKGSREWIVLRNSPVSDRARSATISNQPYAGDNTASLESHYQNRHARARTVRAVTIDGELRRRGLSEQEVLLLKVDVEGHEMSVLQGATHAISKGLVPIILVEYGDKMSPAIWDAMKAPFKAEAAAPSPAELKGPSLYSLQKWGDSHGYDAFLLGALGSSRSRPVMIGLTGDLWRDEYEVCRDKRQKWSSDGRIWSNFSAWNPTWSAVCWYDVALIHRRPRNTLFRKRLLEQTGLPSSFCNRLQKGWYPSWIDRPSPAIDDLCCTHEVKNPRNGDVCHSFFNCSTSPARFKRGQPRRIAQARPGDQPWRSAQARPVG